MHKYVFSLCVCIHRGKTDFMSCGQDMEPCLVKKVHALEEPTQRMVVSVVKVRTIDVEFSDTTLTLPDRMFDKSEYLEFN
jgi:hypothetical protein